jgi:hypothetical protein
MTKTKAMMLSIALRQSINSAEKAKAITDAIAQEARVIWGEDWVKTWCVDTVRLNPKNPAKKLSPSPVEVRL